MLCILLLLNFEATSVCMCEVFEISETNDILTLSFGNPPKLWDKLMQVRYSISSLARLLPTGMPEFSVDFNC
jgi:hypothetical protein